MPWQGILVAYGLAQLLVALPFTPGGFAIVEGGLTAALVAYGMITETALAATLLYRIISFWLLVPVGRLGTREYDVWRCAREAR